MSIPSSAHHLDLRHPSTCDPPDVRAARYTQYNIIYCWIQNYQHGSCQLPNRAYDNSPMPTASSGCAYQWNKYPWGQGTGTAPTTAGQGTRSTTLKKMANRNTNFWHFCVISIIVSYVLSIF